MARSQNNWPVATRDQQDREPLIRDVKVPNGVLKGDVAVVFRWLAREYDDRVERLDAGECWGWHVKEIEGSDVISNHSSGTAVDFNAPDNPMAHGSTERSLTEKQIEVCHAIERESHGVLRWGGDFSRDDPMHWEIVADRAEVAAFAREIKDEEDDMPTAKQVVDELLSRELDFPYDTKRPRRPIRDLLRYTPSRDILVGALMAKLDPQFSALRTQISSLSSQLSTVRTELAALRAELAQRGEDSP